MLSLRGGYEYVDLGLSVKWAKCNVGAEKESDYGYYFQWGDIVDKSNADCSWATYKHCNGSETTMKKYNTSTSYGENPDNKITLDPEDDAATQIMGGNWRMPTKAEFQELIDGTDNQWVTNHNGTGVNGWKFTHKTDTSKYIFIPASGDRIDSSFRGQGSFSGVWSSSLYTPIHSEAWVLFFEFNEIYADNEEFRYIGQTVRGVFK